MAITIGHNCALRVLILVDDATRLAELAQRFVLEVVESKAFRTANLKTSGSRRPFLRSRDANHADRQAITIVLCAKSLSVLCVQHSDKIGDYGDNLTPVSRYPIPLSNAARTSSLPSA